MKTVVYVDRLKESREDVRTQFEEAAESIGLMSRARTAKSVLIKPNLTFPVYKQGVTTRSEFVRGLVEVLLTGNPHLKIFLAEGEGGYNSFSMSDAMRTMGYGDIADMYDQVELLNLSTISPRSVVLDTDRGPYEIDLPSVFFDEVDFAISCPLPKVHAMTQITLSFKNLWGCLPDVMRLKNHYMLPHIVARISRLLKFEYAFLDGKYGLTDNGPMDGTVVDLNWFVAANNLGAFDCTVAGMMGFDWKRVQHLKIADRYGLIPLTNEITVVGEPGILGRQFRLRRELWNYPALAAFHSKQLTQFFYLSGYADFLHEVMYTFRKRPLPVNPKNPEGRPS